MKNLLKDDWFWVWIGYLFVLLNLVSATISAMTGSWLWVMHLAVSIWTWNSTRSLHKMLKE